MSRWRAVHGLALLVTGLAILVELWRHVGLWAAALALHLALWGLAWVIARAGRAPRSEPVPTNRPPVM